MKPQLTEAQIRTELELLQKLQAAGLSFVRRRVNSQKRPFFVEGFVEDVHIWIYDNGGASVVGRGAELMIETEDYDTPQALRTAIVNSIVRLFQNERDLDT